MRKTHNNPTISPASPQEIPGALLAASLGRAGRGATVSSRRCFILGSAFRLNNLGDKSSLRTGAALHEGLGLVYKSIRQGVGANVADRQRLSSALQHKIGAAREAPHAPGRNGPADAHARAVRGAAQRLQFGDGVVISLALAIAKPR